MKSTIAGAVAVLLAVGCTPAGPAAAPEPVALDPVGTFDYTSSFQGQPMNGQLVITGGPGTYGGTMSSNLFPAMPIETVTINGQELILGVNTGDGTAEIRVNFTGDNFTGRWSYAGEAGDIAGQRVRS